MTTARPKRRRFSEREVLETLLHQGVSIFCARCLLPFTVTKYAPDTKLILAHWVGYAEREHLHEIALGGPDETANCCYSAKACHAKATDGTKATSVGSSKHRIAKVKRILRKASRPKKPSRMRSAGFSKAKRDPNWKPRVRQIDRGE